MKVGSLWSVTHRYWTRQEVLVLRRTSPWTRLIPGVDFLGSSHKHCASISGFWKQQTVIDSVCKWFGASRARFTYLQSKIWTLPSCDGPNTLGSLCFQLPVWLALAVLILGLSRHTTQDSLMVYVIIMCGEDISYFWTLTEVIRLLVSGFLLIHEILRILVQVSHKEYLLWRHWQGC